MHDWRRRRGGGGGGRKRRGEGGGPPQQWREVRRRKVNKVRARWPPGSTRRLMVVPSFGRSHYEFVQTPTPPHTSLLTSSCLLSISLCISACFVPLARCTRRGCGDGDGDGDALFVCGRRARRRNHASPRRAAGSMAANLLGKAGRGHSRVLCHDDFFGSHPRHTVLAALASIPPHLVHTRYIP